jgi:hypothetical protein
MMRPIPCQAYAGLVFLLACTGCGNSTPGGNQSKSYPVRPVAQPGGVAGPAVLAGGATADATLTYWNGVNSLPAQMAPEMSAGPQRQVRALRGAARLIRQNPTLGVDPELVNWALRMATILEQRADLTEDSRSPDLLIEAFARGLSGDPAGVAIELNQAERAWLANSRSVTRERYQLRAALTARYGIEFP